MELPSLKDFWSQSNIYERFETIVSSVLALLIAIVVIMSVGQVIATLVNVAASGANFFAYGVIKVILGQILLTLIALEFGHSLILAFKDRRVVFQIQGIVLIGILAVIRKLVLLEIGEVDTFALFGMAAILAGLAVLYWAVNHQAGVND